MKLEQFQELKPNDEIKHRYHEEFVTTKEKLLKEIEKMLLKTVANGVYDQYHARLIVTKYLEDYYHVTPFAEKKVKELMMKLVLETEKQNKGTVEQQ